jgi:glycosyltransferase involved in cell wall biosynthesis
MSTRRIRIAYTIKEMGVGGSQTHLVQVLRLLDRQRFEPVLYCLTGQGVLLDSLRVIGIPVADGGMAHGFKGWRTPAGIFRLARFLRARRIDVVHNYLLRANAIGSVAARLARVPVMLCSKRGCHERRGLELAGAQLGNWLADRVTANADAVRDFVHANEDCPIAKMTVIPSGVDTERFQPLAPADYKARLGLDPQRPVVGIVTRMRVRKGVEEFLRAMALVCAQNPAVDTVVVGEVDLDAELRGMVERSGLGAHLHLIGRRSDMPEVLSAFDVFVLSSHDEGMSNAILEAMAMEKPVVATDVGGTGEVVRHGQTGLLVPAKDPAALATAITELLGAPQRAVEMGRIGRRVVQERFSARVMVRQMEGLYLQLLQERGVTLDEPASSAAEAVSSAGGGHA